MYIGVVAREFCVLEPDQHLRVLWRASCQNKLEVTRVDLVCKLRVLHIAI